MGERADPAPQYDMPQQSGAIRRLLPYVLATALTLATLAARMALGISDEPLLELFLAPIIISAYLGGLGPGLLATGLAAALTDYALLAPTGSAQIASLFDVIEWSVLIAMGTLISALSEGLRRARRRAEASQQLQAITLASIGDAVVTTDAQGRVTFLNREAERLTGWPSADAFGQPLRTIFRIVNEYTRAPVEDPAAKVLRSGLVVGLANHTMLIARDGRETPIDDSGAPIRQADGVIMGVVLVFRDVSAEKKAEAALRESEEQLRIVSETPGIGLALVDASHRYRYTNKTHRDFLRLSVTDLAGERVADVLGPLYEQVVRERLERAFDGEDVNEYITQPISPGVERQFEVRLKRGINHTEPVVVVVLTDITDIKRAEAALQRSARRLRVLADASQVFAEAGTDYQALLSRVAQTVTEGLGHWCSIRLLSDDEASLDLVARYDLRPESPELRDAFLREQSMPIDGQSLMSRIFQQSQPMLIADFDWEWAGVTTKPEYRSVAELLGIRSLIVVPLRAQGRSVGVLSLSRREPPLFDEDDLSLAQDLADRAALAISNARLFQQAQAELAERRQVEQALRESEERLRTVTETAQLGLVLVDQQHRYRYANRAYADIFHLPSAEITGLRVADVLSHVYEAQIRPRLERAFGGERVSYELEVPPAAAGQRERHYAVIYEPAMYRSERVITVMVLDITERKQAEQQLRYQADLLNQVSDAIISTDTSFAIMSWNAAAEALYGWPAHEVIGRLMADVLPTTYFNGDTERAQASLVERGLWRGEVIQPHRDGTPRTILSSVSLLRDRAGKLTGAVGINRDITERKRIEQALQRSAERLRVLADASRTFAETGADYQALLHEIARTTAAVLGEGCSIRLLSDDGMYLPLVALYDVSPEKLELQRALLGDALLRTDEPSLSMTIVTSRHPILVPVVDREQVRTATKPELWSLVDLLGIHSLLVVPLRVQSQAIGILGLYRYLPEQAPFDEDDLTLAQDLADRAALAISNARLLQQVQDELAERAKAEAEVRALSVDLERRVAERTAELAQANAELAVTIGEQAQLEQQIQRHAAQAIALADVSRSLAEAGYELQPLFDLIIDCAVRLIGGATVITALSDDRQWLEVMATGHPSPQGAALLRALPLGPYPAHAGMSGRVVQTGDALLLQAVSPEELRDQIMPEHQPYLEQFGISSLLIVPMRARGRILGSIAILRDRLGAPFTEDDQTLLQNLADRAGLAIENARLFAAAELARVEAERANRAKSAFLASMSHELRTPLNAILGFTGTMLMKLPGPLNADQERQLATVQRSGRHLLALINDLLDLARIEAGKVELSLEPVVCQDVLAEVAAGLRPLAEQKGLAFRVTAPAAPVVVASDRRALGQILINLINNAIKFTDTGEVQIELRREAPGTGQVAFVVRDTGIGILPEDQARLFTEFGRVDSAAVRAREGTGLGLRLSRQLAALLDGRIELASELGVGSAFTLVIGEGTAQ